MFKYLLIFLLSLLFGQTSLDSRKIMNSLLDSGISMEEAMEIMKNNSNEVDGVLNSEMGVDSSLPLDKDFIDDSKILEVENIKTVVEQDILFNKSVNTPKEDSRIRSGPDSLGNFVKNLT